MGRLLLVAFAGGLGGLSGWAVLEPFAPDTFASPRWETWQVLFSLLLGGCIGAAVGGANGFAQGSRAHVWRGFGWGLVLGGIGGYVGLQLGGALSFALFGNVLSTASHEATQILARVTAFLPFGGLVGLAIGAGGRSWPRAMQGLIGGLIGAGIGGMTFDVVSQLFAGIVQAATSGDEIGIIGRGLTSVLIGAAIGLFTAIVELVSRRAWVRLELGRNEGKEWAIDASQSFIGRSEVAHVPLFGDANIAPMHARIDRVDGGYRLVDGGSPLGVGVNGIRVSESALSHGDVINVGAVNLRFLLRNAGVGVAIPRDAAKSARPTAIGLPGQPASPSLIGYPQPPGASSIGAPGPTATHVQPSAQPMTVGVQFSLVAMDGPLAGQRFAIAGELEVGRESTQVSLGFDTTASRRHALFAATDSGVTVRDLGSTNGVFVNGVRVAEEALRAGDSVRIGATSFRIE